MPRLRFDQPWRILWGIATSSGLLVIVLITLACSLALAAWLPQTSKGGMALDVAWRAEIQRRFGGAGWFEAIRGPLETLGGFTVADAVGFRVALALLALCLLARLVDSVEAVWQRRRRDRSPPGATVGDDPEADADAQIRTAQASAREVKRHGDAWPWGELGAIAIYVGGLIVLLGAAVTDRGSWQSGPLALTSGESVPLGNGSDLRLRITAVDADGRGATGEIWRGEEALVGAGNLSSGQPLQGGSVGAYLVGNGTGLQISATLSESQPLELAMGPDTEPQEELVLTFSEAQLRHAVGVPAADLILLLVMPEPTAPDTQPGVQVYEEGSGAFILEERVSEATTLEVKDVTFTLTPLPFVKVQVIHDRGAFWTQLGGVTFMFGVVAQGWQRLRHRLPASASERSNQETDQPAGAEA